MPVLALLEDAGFNFIRFTVPAAFQAALDGLLTGDRFIIAITRPTVDILHWRIDRLLWGTDRLEWAA